MCRSAKVSVKVKLADFLGKDFDIPDYEGLEEANSFDHPDMPVMIDAGKHTIALASWGLIPEWVSTEDSAKRLADACRNARAEDIFEKPSYAPYVLRQRCLMFIEGFYEHQWQDAKGKKKKPFFVEPKDGSLFAAGGLYTVWHHPQHGHKHTTCTMITTAANPLMAEIHNSRQRQPLFVDRNRWADWLNASLSQREVQGLMTVYPDTNMRASEILPPKAVKEAASLQGSLF